MAPNETLLTAKEFASRSGLPVAQVTKMLREKNLKGQKKSGKWMIPADALKTVGASPQPEKATKAAQTTTDGPGLSVSEFSAQTFLTEAGVIQWLKKGRLKGTQVAGGQWRVDAASLELPAVKHLLRP